MPSLDSHGLGFFFFIRLKFFVMGFAIQPKPQHQQMMKITSFWNNKHQAVILRSPVAFTGQRENLIFDSTFQSTDGELPGK